MKASQSIINFLKSIEGLSLAPYWDIKGWSIGYGHFLGGLKTAKPQNISQAQADVFLLSDIAKVETAINNYLATNKLNLSQGRFDALVDFGYNEGAGNLAKVLPVFKTTDKAIYDKFMLYVYAGGVINKGLQSRRKYEVDIMTLNFTPEKKNLINSQNIIDISVVLFIILVIILIIQKRLI